MFKNYLKVAVRNILRQRIFSFINIIGLAIGIACCILILLFVRYELSYDKFNKKADGIYRVTREWFNEDGASSLHLARVAPPIGPLLKNDFPQIVKEETRLFQDENVQLKVGEKSFIENRFFWAEQSTFKIFTVHFVKGNKDNALSEPKSIVITLSMAKKYFGNEDALGKSIKYGDLGELKVTGVIKNVPENSHLKYDFLASFITLYNPEIIGRKTLEENWGSNNYLTYILLEKNISVEQLKSKIPSFIDKYISQVIRRNNGEMPAKALHNYNSLHFQKLTDIHLHSHLTTEVEENGDIKNIYIFSAIALFVLLIACINFMNLSTARSTKRAREIGIRKVLGAYRQQLMKQFIGESVLTVFISLFFSIIIVELTLKTFSNFSQRDLHLNIFSDPFLFAAILVLAIVVGFISGSYPAFLLSSFQPIAVLKGNKIFSRRSLFRTILVVMQFTISIALIIAMGVVFRQIDYVKNKNLGYTKDHLIILPASEKMKNNLESFKSQLLQKPDVKMVTSSKLVPSNMLVNSWVAKIFDKNKSISLNFRLAVDEVDYEFFKTYRIKFSAGRDFSKDYSTDDSAAFILNESAVHKLGWTAKQAIGKRMLYGDRDGRIIGVVQDFNFESLHNEIVPIIFVITKTGNNQITVRISGKDIPATLNFLRKKWTEYKPDYPFDYTFLDDQLAGLYDKDQKIGDVFGIFAIIAIIIASLGLFGLASYTAEARTKEIGIRIVLGAKVSGIITLLLKEFLFLIIIANLIAWPLSYYFMNKWLNEFAYKTGISFWLFIAAGILAIIITIMTISYQSIKAATANPVKSLRYE